MTDKKTHKYHIGTILNLYEGKTFVPFYHIGTCISLAYALTGKKYYGSQLIQASLDSKEILLGKFPWLKEIDFFESSMKINEPFFGHNQEAAKKTIEELADKYGEYHEVPIRGENKKC